MQHVKYVEYVEQLNHCTEYCWSLIIASVIAQLSQAQQNEFVVGVRAMSNNHNPIHSHYILNLHPLQPNCEGGPG